jgi:mannonate dehydratase
VKRRDFLARTGVVAGTGAAALFARSPRAANARAAPLVQQQRVMMKVGCQNKTAKSLWPFLLRHGTRNICSSAPAGPQGYWEVDTLRKLRDDADAAGISVDALMHRGLYQCVETGDVRRRAIERVQGAIRAAGEAGFGCILYGIPIHAVPFSTGSVRGRGSVLCRTWSLEQVRAGPEKIRKNVPSTDEMWERLTYVLERIVPVATEYKVRLACHPQDPPAPPELGRGTSAALGTIEGVKRFLAIGESPYHGLCFCQGTFSEMLEKPGETIYDVIRYFGRRKKIFNVHFRNIRGGRNKFVETFPDEGDVDMSRALQVYQEVGYDGMLMPDHVPSHPDDPQALQGFAFCYGHINGLLQALKTTA